MSPFSGGSPWAMARDIGAGYVLLTDRTCGRMSKPEITKLTFELERHLREIRSEPTGGVESLDLQRRNRRILKLVGAQRVLRAHLQKRR